MIPTRLTEQNMEDGLETGQSNTVSIRVRSSIHYLVCFLEPEPSDGLWRRDAVLVNLHAWLSHCFSCKLQNNPFLDF